MRFILLLILLFSCSTNYNVHERNLQLQHNGMIKQDIIMKNKMTKLRKQGVRSYKKNKISKIRIIPNRKFVIK
jgi:hypothetical protein